MFPIGEVKTQWKIECGVVIYGLIPVNMYWLLCIELAVFQILRNSLPDIWMRFLELVKDENVNGSSISNFGNLIFYIAVEVFIIMFGRT